MQNPKRYPHGRKRFAAKKLRLSSFRSLVALLLLTSVAGFAQQPDLAQLSLEDLMNIEVTSVSKRQQALLDTAGAVYVITQEDIRRSGVNSIPEALRLAPGVQVAQINGYTWAISIRGFNYRYANQLLVLIDGRAVYSPAFSGVFWDLQDTLLEDVDRIEVIRGPGATLWGANAVNGVINIITKSARHTAGGLISTQGGSQGYGSGAARYGGKRGEAFAYRLFGKYSRQDRTPGLHEPGPDAFDAWDMARGGFRADWERSEANSLVFSGDIYRGNEEQTFLIPQLLSPFSAVSNVNLDTEGGDLLAKWRHAFAGGSESMLQVYYDHVNRPMPVARLLQDIVDVDFQLQTHLGKRQELVWGAGYRTTRENVRGSSTMWWGPSRAMWWTPTTNLDQLLNAFVQDQISLVPKRLWLTLGSKFEFNEYTSLQVQPSVRLRWQPHARHTLWAAVSRALRTPSGYEEQARITQTVFPGPQGMPSAVVLFGNSELKSGQLLAYELGYRTQATHNLSLDWTAFYNIYHDITGEKTEPPFLEMSPSPVHVIIPLRFGNFLDARSHGLELASNYSLTHWWRLTASYSWLHEALSPKGVLTQFSAGSDPHHQFQFRSNLSLPRNLEFDNSMFYVGALTGQSVPSYVRLDTRIGWHPAERLEFSLAGQNLLQPRHAEFVFPRDHQGYAQVGRSLYGKLVWHF